jgi:hypothetical protein
MEMPLNAALRAGRPEDDGQSVPAGVLPRVRRTELAGCGHLAPDNTGDPERVAGELRPFFAS